MYQDVFEQPSDSDNTSIEPQAVLPLDFCGTITTAIQQQRQFLDHHEIQVRSASPNHNWLRWRHWRDTEFGKRPTSEEEIDEALRWIITTSIHLVIDDIRNTFKFLYNHDGYKWFYNVFRSPTMWHLEPVVCSLCMLHQITIFYADLHMTSRLTRLLSLTSPGTLSLHVAARIQLHYSTISYCSTMTYSTSATIMRSWNNSACITTYNKLERSSHLWPWRGMWQWWWDGNNLTLTCKTERWIDGLASK